MSDMIHIMECDSTNNALFEINCIRKVKGLELCNEGTLFSCDFQSLGRGQRGNRWHSEKNKNLLLSILLYPTFLKANQQFLITQLVSVTIKNYLGKYTDRISIKWPNDIYWKDKKIGGILIENILMNDEVEQSIVGIGLNINQVDFDDILPNPISLTNITNKSYDLGEEIKDLQKNILETYYKIKSGEITFVIEDYKRSLYRSDGYYPYKDDSGEFNARIIDVNKMGVLTLETSKQEIKRFAFKEVSYII